MMAWLLLASAAAAAFTGDLTYYGGAGSDGACSSDFVPAGYRTVAMNAEQFYGGCGDCLRACFVRSGARECFDAIVDNECPECLYGDIDYGVDGDGRWPVTWDYIACDTALTMSVASQGSNAYYGKIKIQGGPSAVTGVKCDGEAWTGTRDGFWTFEDSFGGLECGVTCEVTFKTGQVQTVEAPQDLFTIHS